MGKAVTNKIIFRYRGRELRDEDIAFIAQMIQAHYARGRSHISRVLCDHWNWRQHNGKRKEYAARDLLLRLEEAGHIALPTRQRVKNNLKAADFSQVPLFVHQALVGRVGDHPPIELRVADGPDRYLWDYLIHHYHYLGRPKLVGEHLKQLVLIGDQVVGCLGWASAAWKVGCRDTFIGWSPAQRRAHLSAVVNNVRFLLLPWIRVEHLASQVLARSARGLSAAWQARYGHPAVLAETFVDSSRFTGTCYHAANWQCLGQTRGHAKRGNAYHCHAKPKAVWLYPLQRHWRRHLLGGLP
jgi:hypothetical protein